MRIACDFDGTIAQFDTTDMVLSCLADPAWESHERAWLAGEISAAACMRAQIALIDPDDAKLDALLDTAELRPGFVEFTAWCSANEICLTVVSDGVDYFIRRILARHGLTHLPVVANHLTAEYGRRVLEQPWQHAGCAAQSGVCKCRAAQSPNDEVLVFIGDGRSDFCVSGRADIVFARDRLAEYCAARGVAYEPFTDFHDIRAVLEAVNGQERLRAAV